MRTLVLNAGYEPLAVVSFRRALVLVMNGKATVLARDDAHPVIGIHDAFERPSVIVLRRYVRVPHSRQVPLTRRGVLRRDGNRCGYCGGFASTIDHVMPRSRGGADTWENLVACCLKCNNIKPRWAGACASSPRPRMARPGSCAASSARSRRGTSTSRRSRRRAGIRRRAQGGHPPIVADRCARPGLSPQPPNASS
jgi:5-methylcytosine-specific restriction endonuclease McrA